MTRRRLMRGDGWPEADESTASGELSGDDHADGGESIDQITDGDRFDDVGIGDAIAQLYADDSAALERWKDRLGHYVDGQGTLDALRLRPTSEQPWPTANNPMLGYLVERAIEIADDDGLGAAVAWLAANSWFEGAISERSRFIRLLDAD